MEYGLHVIKNPKGTFSFVGTVPIELAYTMNDGTPVTDEIAKGIHQCGPGLYRNKIKGIIHNTEAEAIVFAASKGYQVKGQA